MKIFRQLDELPEAFGPTVVSVGNFDGVHRAHRKVLAEVVARAKLAGTTSLAVTFEPHPARVLRPEASPKLLTPLNTKIKLLGETGLDALLVLPFTRELSLTPAKGFAGDLLSRRLRANEVHEGFNFHFGHRAEGNVVRLAEYGHEFRFELKVYPEMKIGRHLVSSSNIRQLLSKGDVSSARRLLGHTFCISALPEHGRGYGHKYTVPTINLARYDEAVPANGVYVTQTTVGGETFDSVTNVGNRPTFGKDSFAIETHLLNFHPIEVSAETEIEVSFLKWLRPEIKWPDVAALRAQIAKDVSRAQRYFRLHGALKSSLHA